MIKVSVIVPVFNAEKYLNKCLDSLLCQTLKEIEVIAVNDGSKDNSLEILREYEKEYDNLVVVDNGENLGIGKSRNRCIDLARGEYMTFVDSDDYVSEDYCERFYEFARNNNLDFVSASTYMDKDGVISIYENERYGISDIKESPDILVKMTYGPCNKLFRTKMINDYGIRFEETLKYEDMPFVAKSLKHGRFGFLEGCYYYYVIHSGSQTTTMTRKNFDIYKILEIVDDYFEYTPYDELEAINIKSAMWHMLLQRDQADNSIRNEHIEKGYEFLDMHFPNWRKNRYFKEESIKTRFVKNHKLLMMLYCWYWRKRYA